MSIMIKPDVEQSKSIKFDIFQALRNITELNDEGRPSVTTTPTRNLIKTSMGKLDVFIFQRENKKKLTSGYTNLSSSSIHKIRFNMDMIQCEEIPEIWYGVYVVNGISKLVISAINLYENTVLHLHKIVDPLEVVESMNSLVSEQKRREAKMLNLRSLMGMSEFDVSNVVVNIAGLTGAVFHEIVQGSKLGKLSLSNFKGMTSSAKVLLLMTDNQIVLPPYLFGIFRELSENRISINILNLKSLSSKHQVSVRTALERLDEHKANEDANKTDN